jgi:hypothetical protein
MILPNRAGGCTIRAHPMSSEGTSRLVLLGPQRFDPAVRDALRRIGCAGPLAVVTAGWQEREAEDRELEEHVGCPVHDLLLYHRADDVFLRDRELAQALRERQEELHGVQELYRVRLGHALDAARELMRRSESGPRIEEQRGDALRALRLVDRQHLRRLRLLHAAFERRWRPPQRAVVARHRQQLARVLERSAGVCIAGGHVAVLLNRLRLFDVRGLLRGRPLIAWSGGAMVACERLVLFHDSPPHGPGNAELFDSGLGLCRGLVALPHAQKRLDLDDRVRVALFARRFAPATCAVLDQGAQVEWDGTRWVAGPETRKLCSSGEIVPMNGKTCQPSVSS